jgi:carboxymethylenebutenolidase
MQEQQNGCAVVVPTSAGEMDGWFVAPGSTPRGAVLVCPEIFGVTAHTRRAAADLAKSGYAALALNLCYRSAPGLELARDEAGRARGLALLQELERDSVLADLSAAIAFLRARDPALPGIAVLGFSSGGHVAYLAACRLEVRIAISFYGGWITGTDIPLSRPEPTIDLTPGMRERGVRFLYLVGDRDFLITSAQREQLERALTSNGVRHEVVVYPDAEHAFLFHDSETSRDAWSRALAALAEELG